MPAVPYKDEMNYNHQAKVCTAIHYEINILRSMYIKASSTARTLDGRRSLRMYVCHDVMDVKSRCHADDK